MARPWRALVLALLLAGCAAPGGRDLGFGASGDEDACRDAPASRHSGNAPRLPVFQGEPEEVLRRLAGLVGVQPRSDRGSLDDHSQTYLLDIPRGRMSMRLDGSYLVQWWMDGVWPALDPGEAERVVRTYLDDIEAAQGGALDVRVSEDSTRNSTLVEVDAREGDIVVLSFYVRTESYYGERMSGWIGPFHDLSAAQATFPREDAVAAAEVRAACEGASVGDAAEVRGFAVRHDSLVYSVSPPGSPGVTFDDGSFIHGCPPA